MKSVASIFEFFTILLLAFFPNATFALDESEAWTCAVDASPAGQSVKINLPTPTVDYFLKYVDTDGKPAEKHEEIITATRVVSAGAERNKCIEAVSTSGDGLQYRYRFTCGVFNGYLQFRRNEREGFFFQQVGTGGPSRSFKLVSCVNAPVPTLTP